MPSELALRRGTWIALAALIATAFIVAVAAGVAGAQNTPTGESASEANGAEEPEPAKPSVDDPSKPMGPPDPFNRGTPRGAMSGFLGAAHKGDYERAAEFLDLRRLPPREREDGPTFARQLKSVLDQKLWIDLSTLSDLNEGAADDGLPSWQDRLGDIETSQGLVTLLLQRVPRNEDGVRIWKVSSATVARTDELYQEFGPTWVEDRLPPIFIEVQLLGIELWQWLGLALLAVAGWAVSLLLTGTIVRVMGRVVTRKDSLLDHRIVRVVQGPVRLALIVGVFAFGRRYLALDASTLETLRVFERLLWVFSFAWLSFRVMDIFVLGLRVRAEARDDTGVVPALVPLQRFAKVVIVLFGVLGVLGTLGVNITAAVAGLGVGGIAVALAAQKTIENLFGGVSLFLDRPVQVGDYARYGDQTGTIEEIGLRSTRVRTLDRTIVTIPNAEFSNLKLENFAVRDRMRIWTLIGVRYETTPDQLRYLLTRMREVLIAHPRVTAEPSRVRFVGFGAYSLDIEVFAYVDTSDWSELLGIREHIYLQFIDVVAEAGTGFAFPSSTTYIGRDSGLDEEAGREAEARVAQWRERGELPFPNIPDDLRQTMENTDAWPPEGAPRPSSE